MTHRYSTYAIAISSEHEKWPDCRKGEYLKQGFIVSTTNILEASKTTILSEARIMKTSLLVTINDCSHAEDSLLALMAIPVADVIDIFSIVEVAVDSCILGEVG